MAPDLGSDIGIQGDASGLIVAWVVAGLLMAALVYILVARVWLPLASEPGPAGGGDPSITAAQARHHAAREAQIASLPAKEHAQVLRGLVFSGAQELQIPHEP